MGSARVLEENASEPSCSKGDTNTDIHYNAISQPFAYAD
jgi:hypothetical protein